MAFPSKKLYVPISIADPPFIYLVIIWSIGEPGEKRNVWNLNDQAGVRKTIPRLAKDGHLLITEQFSGPFEQKNDKYLENKWNTVNHGEGFN